MGKHALLITMGIVLMAVLGGCFTPLPPVLELDPDGTLDFGEDVEKLFLIIDNGGGGLLHWYATVLGEADWLHFTPREGIGRGALTLTVDRSGLDPDTTYSAELLIVSNGGEAKRTVTVGGGGEDIPLPTLPRVEELTVTGFTVPKGMFAAGSQGTMAGEYDNVLAGGAYGAEAASMLHEFVRQFDRTSATSSSGAPGFVTSFSAAFDGKPGAKPDFGRDGGISRMALPSDYEAAFVLSWATLPEADGYRIFARASAEDSSWNFVTEVSAEELEYDDEGYGIFVLDGDFDIGEEQSYAVTAVGAGWAEGERSVEDRGIIMPPARLLAPAPGSDVTGKPRFEWEAQAGGTGYGVYVTMGSLTDHVWHVVLGGDEMDVRYPGDDPYAEPTLAPGEYAWYIVARGPIVNGKNGGMAV